MPQKYLEALSSTTMSIRKRINLLDFIKRPYKMLEDKRRMKVIKEALPILTVVIIIIALLVGWGTYYYTKKNDSFLEQTAEKVLQRHGLYLDFSPDDE